MTKYTRIKSYSPKKIPKTTKVAKALKPTKKHGPVAGFFVARWQWFKKLSKPKKALVIGTPILAFLILTPIFTYLYYANAISDPDRLMNYNNTGVVLLDKNGDTFYSFGTADRGERLGLDKISDYAEKALVSAEDKNFYEHAGFSLISIIGALYANLLNGDATGYGGSTLTQQLAKNTLLTEDQTLLRKYQELTIALAIEQNYSKDEILDLYLNSVYYGEGAFGIGNAAKAYFGKSAADLTLAESTMLIGVLPAPSAYSPITGNAEYAKERQGTVLGRMVDNKAITQEEADAAKAEVLAYAPAEEGVNGTAPHFAEMVINDLYEKYGEERVTRSGFRVSTTLDANLQQAANEAVDKQIGFIQRNGGSNASVLAVDPATGEIRALVGSADYNNTEFGKVNMANTARQPGSSIKPLYYTEALQRGIITPATIMEDKPTNFGGYQPQNADRRFRGSVSIRSALSQSLNIPSVEVMQDLGVKNAVAALRRLGVETINDSTDYGLSLALGSAEAKLTDMTNAYAALANGGKQHELTTVTRIEDKFEKQVFKSSTSSPKEVMGEGASFIISDILNDESARAPIFGSSLNTSGYDVAVKTGTTDEARDAWTIGYAKQLAVGVWVGNNNNTPMRNGGSSMAGPIWRATMLAGLKGQNNQPFTMPAGSVERLLVCKSNGLRATGGGTDGTHQEYFLKNALPKGTCDVPKPPADTDKDGVIDDLDECADTPSGTAVDEAGCPVETDPKDDEDVPATTDTDGDGVIDTDDDCANTPEGTEVDKDGCPVTTDEEDEDITAPLIPTPRGRNGL